MAWIEETFYFHAIPNCISYKTLLYHTMFLLCHTVSCYIIPICISVFMCNTTHQVMPITCPVKTISYITPLTWCIQYCRNSTQYRNPCCMRNHINNTHQELNALYYYWSNNVNREIQKVQNAKLKTNCLSRMLQHTPVWWLTKFPPLLYFFLYFFCTFYPHIFVFL